MDIERYLEDDSKVHVRRTLNPWLVADHTKLIVADDEVALLGGMNIGREYFSEWHDLMVRIDGPVVRDLARDFEETWRQAGPWGDLSFLLPDREIPETRKSTGEGKVRLLRTDAANGKIEVFVLIHVPRHAVDYTPGQAAVVGGESDDPAVAVH